MDYSSSQRVRVGRLLYYKVAAVYLFRVWCKASENRGAEEEGEDISLFFLQANPKSHRPHSPRDLLFLQIQQVQAIFALQRLYFAGYRGTKPASGKVPGCMQSDRLKSGA